MSADPLDEICENDEDRARIARVKAIFVPVQKALDAFLHSTLSCTRRIRYTATCTTQRPIT